jgi:hypothetical protein
MMMIFLDGQKESITNKQKRLYKYKQGFQFTVHPPPH